MTSLYNDTAKSWVPCIFALTKDAIIYQLRKFQENRGIPVRDVTWMSALSVHLAKWTPALGQVTDSTKGGVHIPGHICLEMRTSPF